MKIFFFSGKFDMFDR